MVEEPNLKDHSFVGLVGHVGSATISLSLRSLGSNIYTYLRVWSAIASDIKADLWIFQRPKKFLIEAEEIFK